MYEQSTVFTVSRRGALAGPRYEDDGNGEFDVAVITFDDEGRLVSESGLTNAVACIDAARERFEAGAIVVVFVHGWHHSADWDVESDGGDAHFREFRRVLMTLAYREKERPAEIERRVVGIYLGWNGDPIGSLSALLPSVLTFWNRIRVARRVGEGDAVQRVVVEILTHTKRPIARNGLDAPGCPLVVCGHSMGALIVASAFRRFLRERRDSLTRRSAPIRGEVQVTRDDEPIEFPDLLMLVNSAADSRIVQEIMERLAGQRVRKSFQTQNQVRFLAPLLISLTSTHDWATRCLWKAANPGRRTDGHDREVVPLRDWTGCKT